MLGVLAALVAGAVLSLLFGFLTLTLVSNQVATGLALTLLGLGLSGLIGESFVGQPGVQLDQLHIPGLTDIPFVGPILFGQDLLVYLSLVIVAGRLLRAVPHQGGPHHPRRGRQPPVGPCAGLFGHRRALSLRACSAAPARASRAAICRSSTRRNGWRT